ncbi:hypothetical protein Mgra_00008162 [Meloidogyne graminicola]|uniref:Uncharacterized protein n=1 Tax=Meloidogyne graminicola TaxID=189291 RepID=A0A8S9ZGM4_9BILA|nr:hypothetical protein Mgra_00008162 [Meloidogyne graminicola]
MKFQILFVFILFIHTLLIQKYVNELNARGCTTGNYCNGFNGQCCSCNKDKCNHDIPCKKYYLFIILLNSADNDFSSLLKYNFLREDEK